MGGDTINKLIVYKNIKHNSKVYITATFIFFIINILLFKFHETWLDEFQAWEI